LTHFDYATRYADEYSFIHYSTMSHCSYTTRDADEYSLGLSDGSF